MSNAKLISTKQKLEYAIGAIEAAEDQGEDVPQSALDMVERVRDLEDYLAEQGVDLFLQITGFTRADQSYLRRVEAELKAVGWNWQEALRVFNKLVQVGATVAGLAGAPQVAGGLRIAADLAKMLER